MYTIIGVTRQSAALGGLLQCRPPMHLSTKFFMLPPPAREIVKGTMNEPYPKLIFAVYRLDDD